VEEIILAPLSFNDMKQLVTDSLHCESIRARPLAQVVHEKTGGNPFFAIQFLTALAEEKLLVFDSGTAAWSWDRERIRAKGYTDNVVELMAKKLQRLPRTTQQALKQLACLGNNAKISTLQLLCQESEHSIQEQLWDAARAGLVFSTEGLYTFLHDRIEEAAYSLVPESERAAMHLRIGRLLVSSATPEKIGEEVFEIVSQFNRAASLITSLEERKRVAELNLVAGKRAKISEAYASALNFFAASEAFLAGDCWDRDHALTFDILLNRAECEFRTGLLTEAEEHLSISSRRAANNVEDAAVVCLRVALYTTQVRFDHAIEACLDYLRRVGVEWSVHPTKEDLEREYAKMWERVGSRAVEQLEEVVILTQSEVRRNNVALHMELSSNLPCIMGDRLQLQQVVMNLILNAIEAMSTVEDGDRNLVIRTQCGEVGAVRVSVQDSGIGFDPIRAQRIFDAFYTTKPDGLGMGLTISRSIVEWHGGRLWAQANDGPGATFQFTLPKRE
jgi:predicted ATPase